MRIYAYSKPGQMVNHDYSDDVAITIARTKRAAVRLFRELYGDCTRDDVRVFNKRFLMRNIVILTDY